MIEMPAKAPQVLNASNRSTKRRPRFLSGAGFFNWELVHAPLRHGILKSKLAKLRTELLAPPKKVGGEGEGFEVGAVQAVDRRLLKPPQVQRSKPLHEHPGFKLWFQLGA